MVEDGLVPDGGGRATSLQAVGGYRTLAGVGGGGAPVYGRTRVPYLRS